ncbi:DNA alkylation response protein [Alkalilimnicola ehrlichii]|uniref:DNA alkylation response protein n=1 Tax=Alkalilimnicola ehrlichii TaxID=351052 RepID=A0A3E0X1C4_9GAMM|nr:acyl-CoA dehydrogenase family protein [Alkalilimnicola ehrlichii]RFA30414.1 DNA alkylation response protein [Alkalilimnicola ehrlichii]RFA37967.1 DNA alkylation response protein [Alkalilimnicola ehrlichii]
MKYRTPMTQLPTHEVTNQAAPLGDYNACDTDIPLREALQREAPSWVLGYAQELGQATGSEFYRELGFLANQHVPELKTFDRYGHRVDEVEFHPAYHDLMSMAIRHDIHSIAWKRPGEGGAVAHTAAMYLLTQPEQGVCCPITMTHAVVPALRHQPELAAEWEPRILSSQYDPRCLPAGEKTGVTFGMAMTEKQGGSDVRANTTRAVPLGKGGPGADYELVGHKWFCSAPMSDGFLTLAQTEAGLSCFLVPRWRPDGSRNPFFIQRLKDKLGNRSNASSEIEYNGTYAVMVGAEGRGVATIIEMVHQTRLDAATAPPGMMRHALVQAVHHAKHRKAFGELLINQPLMRNVLADLALEVEAATAMVMRVARAFDESHSDTQAQLFSRIATPVTKFWTNKRAPEFIYETMECLGGAGYVEESGMPRLYREAPLNSIWEGSGNVICLDILRAMQREPETVSVFMGELQGAAGGNVHLDRAIERLQTELRDPSDVQLRARRVASLMALSLQASLLVRHAPAAVADAFCATRLGADAGDVYGTLPVGADLALILERTGLV